MTRKKNPGNPLALMKGTPYNPRMSEATKQKAMARLRRMAQRRGQLPKFHRPTRQPRVNVGQQISQPVKTSIAWYLVLLIGSFITSFHPVSSAVFSIFQLGLLLSDVEEAEQGHKLLQNTIGALVTLLIGLALNDVFAWGGAAIIVGVISLVVFAKAKAYVERLS